MPSSKHQCVTPRDSKRPARTLEAHEAKMMAASCTPAPPPLYDTQWLPSPPESIMDFYQNSQESRLDNHCFHSGGNLGMPVSGSGDNDFGSKLLEYAFTQLQQDQAAYALKDTNQYHNRIQKPTIPATRKKSKVSRDKRPPMPSLAATHPSLYRAVPPMSTATVAAPPPLSSSPPKAPNRQDSIIAPPTPASNKQHTPLEVEVPPWQRFTDPKRLQSDEPKFDDPTPRYLLDDIRPGQAQVISPVPLIGLPLGGIIEAATVYSK